MDDTQSKSGLILPPRTGKLSRKRDITIASIDQWRSQLPLSDLSSSAKALYFTLQDIYQSSIPNNTRYDILVHLRPTISYICQTLQKMYYHQEILNDRQRLVADLIGILNYEMLNNYKLVIEECSKSFFPSKKILLSSLQNAFSYCSKIIFEAYHQHRTPMPGIWLEFHKLYEYAQEKGLENKSLPKSAEWLTRFETLADIYKHSLLFAISNPQRLRREEITHLMYALETWAPLLVLRKGTIKTSVLYLVDITVDSPPKFASLYSEYPKDCYYLMLDKVNDRLLKLLSLQNSQNKEEQSKSFLGSELALPPAFVKSLYEKWHSISERAHKRTSSEGHITACLGISACYWYINNNSPAAETSMNDTQNAEVIDMDVLPTQVWETKTTKYPKFTCELIDQSEGGFRLKWPKEIPPQLQSGEIIGLARELENQTVWSIGTIRWLKIGEDHSISIGVQILSLEALAVKAHLIDSSSQYGVSALLFPEQPERDKPMTMITPTLPFKSGNEIEVEYAGQSYAANLRKNFSISSNYQEFELEFLYKQLMFPYKVGKLQPTPEINPQPLQGESGH